MKSYCKLFDGKNEVFDNVALNNNSEILSRLERDRRAFRKSAAIEDDGDSSIQITFSSPPETLMQQQINKNLKDVSTTNFSADFNTSTLTNTQRPLSASSSTITSVNLNSGNILPHDLYNNNCGITPNSAPLLNLSTTEPLLNTDFNHLVALNILSKSNSTQDTLDVASNIIHPTALKHDSS